MMSRNSYLNPRATAPAEGVEVFLHHHPHNHYHHHHHHHPHMLPALYSAPTLENATYFNQDNGGLTGEASAAAAAAANSRKPAAKKDRHSKIYTSQGPRDRRVRLSIAIARKFFDLQEMLVFDKPSKTLDWLLTKSKAAIKELVQTKQKAAVSECELLSSSDSKRKNLAKESRAKARARARERTLEKMCIKQLGGSGVTGSDLVTPPSEFKSNQLDFLQLSAGCSGNSVKMSGAYGNDVATRDLIQESVMIKRDLNSNYMISSADQNWDFSGFWDQHKFIDNNSNI